MDFTTAHKILCHQEKSETRARAKKLGWKIMNDYEAYKDCLLGIIREKNINKKVNYKATKIRRKIFIRQ